MGLTKQFALLSLGLSQVLFGSGRTLFLILGLVALFLPYFLTQIWRDRHSRMFWIYLTLLVIVGSLQTILTGEVWPMMSSMALALAFLALDSIGPQIIEALSKAVIYGLLVLFAASTVYASVDESYMNLVRSSSPPLALASLVLVSLRAEQTAIFFVGLILFTLLVFVWDTRAEALAVFVFLGSFMIFRSRGLMRIVSATVTAAVPILFLMSDFWVTALKLQDSHRGIDSGLTGRVGAYMHSLDLIKENIFLGVGYRRQEFYFTDVTYWSGFYEYPISSTHNGVLAVLLEWGLIGSLILLFPLVSKYRCWSRNIRISSTQPIMLSFCAFTMFERYYINFGNVYSVILIALVFCWFKSSEQFDRLRLRKPLLRSAN